MATILTFLLRPEKVETKLQPDYAAGVARVIMFTGVRYERIPEVPAAIVKSNKKSLKTA